MVKIECTHVCARSIGVRCGGWISGINERGTGLQIEVVHRIYKLRVEVDIACSDEPAFDIAIGDRDTSRININLKELISNSMYPSLTSKTKANKRELSVVMVVL